METKDKYSRQIINISDHHTKVDVEIIKQENFGVITFNSFNTNYRLAINNGEFMQLLKILEIVKQKV